MRILKNWRLAVAILPLVALAVITKIITHHFGWEMLELNTLFSGAIGATVFLIGFMIAGTLSDFKESERLPSDMAASLYSIADECQLVTTTKGRRAADAARQNLDTIAKGVLDWMRKDNGTHKIFASIDALNQSFAALEPHTQATYINRLKGEQNQLRRLTLRMQTIRETSFVGTAYAIAELSTLLLVISLAFAKGHPFFESLFFIGFITFVLTYMIALITDLDNPFNFHNELIGDEISLKPLEQFRRTMRRR